MATSTLWAEQAHFVEKARAITGETFGRYLADANAVAEKLTTREAIIDALTANGESFATHLAAMSDEQLAETVSLPASDKGRMELLLGVKEHEMHHRAQLMLMERRAGLSGDAARRPSPDVLSRFCRHRVCDVIRITLA